MVLLMSRDECYGFFLLSACVARRRIASCSKRFSDNTEEIRHLSINDGLTDCKNVALGRFMRHTSNV